MATMSPYSPALLDQTTAPVRGRAAHSVLVATDGGLRSYGALALASWLARSRDAHVRILSVVEPTCGAGVFEDLDSDVRMADRCKARRRAVLERIDGIDQYASPWPVTVVAGSSVTLVSNAANAPDVDLLVIGLPRASDESVFHDDTALRIFRRSLKPVVAVGDSFRVPPRVCVAAIDFTPSSLHAARAAAALLAPSGTLYLVHVQPELHSTEDRLRLIYAQGIVGAFERIVHGLEAPGNVHVRHALLDGNPRVELAAFCDQVDADLMALGTTRPEVARLQRGRLACSFLRGGTRSLLVAPAAPRVIGPTRWDD